MLVCTCTCKSSGRPRAVATDAERAPDDRPYVGVRVQEPLVACGDGEGGVVTGRRAAMQTGGRSAPPAQEDPTPSVKIVARRGVAIEEPAAAASPEPLSLGSGGGVAELMMG